MLVHSKGVEKHFEDIEEMMRRAEEAKMVFKVSKMKIAMTEIRIWSWVISEGCVQADLDQIKAVKNAVMPKTVKDI